MACESIAGLIAQLYQLKIDRREFSKRATAAGLSAALAGNVLTVHAARAQDEMSGSMQVGMPNVGHTAGTSKGTIKLYSSWPLTGVMERTGGHAVAGSELCLEDFGFASGGFAIEYEALDGGTAASDGRWDRDGETENANTAVNDADAMVYLGTYNSGAAAISLPIINEAGMAMISFANSYPGLTKALDTGTAAGEPDIYYPTGVRNYMRVCPTDDRHAAAGARWAFNESGHRRAYVLHDNSLYGVGVASLFDTEFVALGGESLGLEAYDPQSTNYQPLMAAIAALEPDIVYVGATYDNNAATLVQAMRGVMSPESVTLLAPSGLNSNVFVQGAAGAAEGAWMTFGGYTADELERQGGAGADFVARMRERLGLGEAEVPDAWAVYAYEAMVVTLQAIERAATRDRTAILAAMFSTEGFVSLFGRTWSFTSEGDIDAPVIGLTRVIDDVITFQTTIS
jgi:branched-chain amino acid transport system substrate-binding protein